jgi:hypothetical protein
MRLPENGKSWLLGLLGGAVLVGIQFFLAYDFGIHDWWVYVGVFIGASLIGSAASAWIVSLWTHSWDAGMKAGCITGVSDGIGVFCVVLTILLVLTGGQLSAGRGYALGAVLAYLIPCILGICIAPLGALIGCKMAAVE